MSAPSFGASPLVALLVLLAALFALGGAAGPPSEAASATPPPPATVQQGAGRAGQSPTVLGDINNDGIVDIRDYGVWRHQLRQPRGPQRRLYRRHPRLRHLAPALGGDWPDADPAADEQPHAGAG